MVLKFIFFDKAKYNESWINRLFDRIEKVKERKWVVTGGGKLGSESAEWSFNLIDGTKIEELADRSYAQRLFNQIVWCFVVEQINVERFIVDGNDLTTQMTHR